MKRQLFDTVNCFQIHFDFNKNFHVYIDYLVDYNFINIFKV